MCYSALVKRDLDYLSRTYGATVVRTQTADYHRASAMDPKAFPPLADRIFPGYYAPVILAGANERRIELMRYGAYPPPMIAKAKAFTTFNARRDNLTSSFWSGAFMQHHGFVVLAAFYEWVAVKDLLKAGVVTLPEVEAEFARLSEERRQKILAQGKKYKPTPTELKDPRLRQIVIEFQPEDQMDLLAPVIFNYGEAAPGQRGGGFAIVTDDPPLEISAAGHDRCPVILAAEALPSWLHPERADAKDLAELLGHKRRVSFRHKLAEAA